MDFDEMNNFLSHHKVGEQDIRVRIRKRSLESRERRVLGTLSCAYGFDLFVLCMGLVGTITEAGSMQRVQFAPIVGGLSVAILVLGLAIYRMWRNPPPSPILLSLPGVIFFVMGLPKLNILFFVNAIALVALYTLGRIWKELKSLSERSVQPA